MPEVLISCSGVATGSGFSLPFPGMGGLGEEAGFFVAMFIFRNVWIATG
jgi:hypothetical protein